MATKHTKHDDRTKGGTRIPGQGAHWLRSATRLALYSRDGWRCIYCTRHVEDGIVLTIDHVIACEDGGTNRHDNLVTACLACNSAKGSQALTAWRAYLRAMGTSTAGLAKRLTHAAATPIDRKEGRRLLNLRGGIMGPAYMHATQARAQGGR